MNDTIHEIRPFISLEGVSKKFRLPASEISVLENVSFTALRGEWTALLGASGSGKTTLLDIIGTLSKPDSGSVSIGGTDASRLSSSESVVFRRRKIGFVFQACHMLPELNISENVMLPAMLDGRSAGSEKRAVELLERMGLGKRLKHRPNELSGGEQQRAAIARALINSPDLLLADEPTGNLDSVTGGEIMNIFREIKAGGRTTIIMVTHDKAVAEIADRIVTLKDGRIFNHGE